MSLSAPLQIPSYYQNKVHNAFMLSLCQCCYVTCAAQVKWKPDRNRGGFTDVVILVLKKRKWQEKDGVLLKK